MKYVVLLLIVLIQFGNSAEIRGQLEKTLVAREIDYDGEIDLQKVSQLLEQQTERHSIDVLNWNTFRYRPKVEFRIAYCNNQIWLKYYVEETNILAERTETNSWVSRDSCVEFFFDPQGDGNYYNFEFNCIGTTLLQYRPYGEEQKFVAPELIKKHIKIESSLGDEPFSEKTGDFKWEMTIIIPTAVLTGTTDLNLKELSSKANFYKCGSATSRRHYLSWNPIKSEKPNFHLPEYFGDIIFE